MGVFFFFFFLEIKRKSALGSCMLYYYRPGVTYGSGFAQIGLSLELVKLMDVFKSHGFIENLCLTNLCF